MHHAAFRLTDGWLPALAVGGMAAGCVAYNLEMAPVTGRPQLILGKYKSPPASTMHLSCAMPQLVPTQPCPLGPLHTELSDQGYEILKICYERVCAAVADLAETDPALQRRLAFIPDKIELSQHVRLFSGHILTSALEGKWGCCAKGQS